MTSVPSGRPRALTEENLRALDAVRPPQRLTGASLDPRLSNLDKFEQAFRSAKQQLSQKRGWRHDRAPTVGHPSTFSALSLDFCPRSSACANHNQHLQKLEATALALRKDLPSMAPRMTTPAAEPVAEPAEAEKKAMQEAAKPAISSTPSTSVSAEEVAELALSSTASTSVEAEEAAVLVVSTPSTSVEAEEAAGPTVSTPTPSFDEPGEDDDTDVEVDSTDDECDDDELDAPSPSWRKMPSSAFFASTASTFMPDSAFRSFCSDSDRSVRTISARIVGCTKIDRVYEYHIKVTDGERQWMVHRRYTHFEQLNSEIGSEARLPPLPEKSTVRKRLSRNFREKRQQALERYLKSALFADPSASRWEALGSFLSIDDCGESQECTLVTSKKESAASVVIQFVDHYEHPLDSIAEDDYFKIAETFLRS